MRTAATLFVFALLFFQTKPGAAAVRIDGLNEWLTLAAERSLNAVYEHIPSEESQDVKEQLLRVVANRLLQGYRVDEVRFQEDVTISLVVANGANIPVWSVSLVPPNLSPPVDEWFSRDIAGLEDEVKLLMKNVPVEALLWGDTDLKLRIEEMCKDRLPGWRVSLMVHTKGEGTREGISLEVAFTPAQPLTLAVSPRISSTSIPVMLHSNLKDDLLKGFAPVIGIPVPWLDKHADDLVVLAKFILSEEYLVEKAKAEADIGVTTGSVSQLDIDLESRRYSAWVWMAVYAGAEDRYPEAGLHFGRRVQPFSGWETELYTEFIMSLDDWDLETRLGMRWAPYRDLWLGGEWSSDGNLWWARAMIEPRLKRRPYAWARFSEDGDTNAALGLRITDYLSIEVHYDSRDEDPWNVRALVNL
ncbi:hypothetical protein LJC31_05185 [Synergistaceae bacterium OttesenSCG-928-I11]|nr:hypothetical protein [Synergistaceae bacterium OttesenSCG-928-I11]